MLLWLMISAVTCHQEALQGRCAMAAISAVFSAVASAAEIATGPPDPDRYVASPLLLSPEVRRSELLRCCLQPGSFLGLVQDPERIKGCRHLMASSAGDLAVPARFHVRMF